MKTLLAAATLSLLSAAAFAKAVPTVIDGHSPQVEFVFQGDGLVPVYKAPLTRTRAEVQAELKASQERMDYVFMGDEWLPRETFVSMRSRAEVRAEAAASRQRAAVAYNEFGR